LRDELAAWQVSSLDGQQDSAGVLEREAALFNSILSFDHDFCTTRIKPNIELFNKRILTLACVKETEMAHSSQLKNDEQPTPPANQAILDLISCATNPQKLALMDPVWQPWF
jgi:phosphatidylinositol kinase/protein kinase (PI-3  family)